jgi:hypothetical protein
MDEVKKDAIENGDPEEKKENDQHDMTVAEQDKTLVEPLISQTTDQHQTATQTIPNEDKTTVQPPREFPAPKTKTEESTKPPWALYSVIILLVTAIGVLLYLQFIKTKPTAQNSAQIKQMQELTQKVQDKEAEKKEKQDEIIGIMGEIKDKTKQDSLDIDVLNLNEDEKELLGKKIKEEKDVSVKALLQEILDKTNEIRDLNAEIAEIEKLLPLPHVVQTGENHYQIAMDFLINEKKLDKKKAMELVERTAVFDTLVPGFKVWNFYTGDEYGTSVTQGTAAVSPNTLIRQAKKKLVDARDQAVSERDKLSEDIKVLEQKREKIIGQVDLLTKEKESLIGKVSDLNVEVNSLYYLLDSQKNLKKNGILKGGFLKSTKLRDVSPEHFNNTIDLRNQTDILISAANLGLRKIKSISIFPKFYKPGTDFKIVMGDDKLTATVSFLDAKKFKNERIVISVK